MLDGVREFEILNVMVAISIKQLAYCFSMVAMYVYFE